MAYAWATCSPRPAARTHRCRPCSSAAITAAGSRPTSALPVSRAALAPFGASPGAGVVLALPANACGLRESARIAGYLAGQTAGQCGPCVNGLPRIASTLAELANRYGARRPGCRPRSIGWPVWSPGAAPAGIRTAPPAWC